MKKEILIIFTLIFLQSLISSANDTTCTPNWQCGIWEPATCPDSKTQTRDCTDLNQCGNLIGMPESAKSCSKNFAWLVVFIILILIILIIGDLGIIKEKILGHKHSKINTITPR